MKHRKALVCALVALVAALALAFGAATPAKAEGASDNALTAVLDDGMAAINKDVSGYANLAWEQGSPTATSGTVITTITKSVTISSVKTDIVDTLVDYLSKNANLVSEISLVGNTIMGTTPGHPVVLEVTEDMDPADVTAFAKECFDPSAYAPGSTISVLYSKSFTVHCEAIPGSGALSANYTMKFAAPTGEDNPVDEVPTTSEIISTVAGSQTTTAINNLLAEKVSVEAPTAAGSDGSLTWQVTVEDGLATIEDVAQNLVGNVIASTVPIVPAGTTANSVDDPSITFDFDDVNDSNALDDFALRCLQAAAAKGTVTTQAASDSIVGTLVGKSCTIQLNFPDETKTTYVFDFSGSSVVRIYRLYNQWSGEHLFTADAAEYADLMELGWINEDIAWNAPDGGTAVYRLYNPYSYDHFYTSDVSERDHLIDLGWLPDFVGADGAPQPAFYSVTNGSTFPVYQLFNPYEQTGTHLWTTSEEEYQDCEHDGWVGEHEKFYALSVPE